MTLSESRLSIITARADRTEDRSKIIQAQNKRRFWLGWIGAFGLFGVMSGSAALVISLLTACSLLKEVKGLSIFVAALLLGWLGALLLSAHGMDRLAALRWEEKR